MQIVDSQKLVVILNFSVIELIRKTKTEKARVEMTSNTE